MDTPATTITVKTSINAPVEKVWELWSNPEHIIKWSSASDDWHTPKSENDLRPGGRFESRMEAKDGSMGFDFGGTYDAVEHLKLIEYKLDDQRKVTINFSTDNDTTNLEETFDAESSQPVEMQQGGWQAILDHFKRYVEESKD